MPTDTQVNDLKINVLSEAQYEQIQSPSNTELYLVPEVVDTTPTSESTNTITSGGVYDALQSLPEGVFMCNYNTSTHTMDKTPEQILQAKENGMAVLCKDGTTRVYHCTAANQSTIFFECLYSDNSSNLIYIIKWVSNSGWTTSSKLLQDKLVSSGNSQNIKTINNTSLLGSGNIDTSNVQAFADGQEVNDVHIVDDLTTGGSDNVLSASQGKVLYQTISKNESLANEVCKYITIEFDCSNIVLGKCLRPTGGTLNVTNGAYCTDFFPVNAGMKVTYQACGTGTTAAIICYDYNKSLTENALQIGLSANYREWTIPDGTAYIRISTEKYTTYGLKCYVKADKKLSDVVLLEGRTSDLEKFHTDLYRLNTDEDFNIADSGINPFALNNPTFLAKFKPATQKIEFKYQGKLTNEKRYATLGFDDFRIGDFAYVIPMLDKYGAKAEFNLIKWYSKTSSEENLSKERQNILQCAFSGQEIGDHTFRHEKFPFSDPMWNGQNPASLDGTQTPYPSNDQMRVDVGNGVNYFGVSLSEKPYSEIKYRGQSIDHTWANLTDDECQAVRNWYSLFGDINDETIGETGHSGLLPYLDSLSNTYLGTSGSSKGSWIDVEGETNGGHYSGGIYTGMHSSANEEIWERYMQLVDIYTKDLYGYNGRIKTFSMPGSKSSYDAKFFFYGTDPNFPSSKYYDIDRTIPLNYNSRWESATLKNLDGTPKVRSFTELLREFGYVATHDYDVPGRIDNLGFNAYQIRFFPNADLSQLDGVGRFNNYELYKSNPAPSITNNSWFISGKKKETELYDRIDWYRGAIEVFRQYTGGGRFAGLVADTIIDSQKIYGYMSVFEGLVKYCKAAGIELLTTQEAYDVAFNHRLDNGNLIYNPYLRNTAKEFLVGEDTNANYQVPDNPDGYYGNCSVEKDTDDGNVNVLVTAGDVRYEHWGIPYGHLEYIADVKGEGTITIYEFKNKTALETWYPQGTTINAKQIKLSDCGSSIADKTVSSASDFSEQKIEFVISNNDYETWTDRTEIMGDKVIGIVIVYSSGLKVKNVRLRKVK